MSTTLTGPDGVVLVEFVILGTSFRGPALRSRRRVSGRHSPGQNIASFMTASSDRRAQSGRSGATCVTQVSINASVWLEAGKYWV